MFSFGDSSLDVVFVIVDDVSDPGFELPPFDIRQTVYQLVGNSFVSLDTFHVYVN